MVEMSVRYEGDLRCHSEHGPSGKVLPTDAPVDNLGKGESFSPTDLTATSLATCMLTTMAIAARKKDIPVDLAGASARVRKHMTPQPPRRIARLEVEILVPQEVPLEYREFLVQAAETCPVALSLHPDIEKAVSFRWER